MKNESMIIGEIVAGLLLGFAVTTMFFVGMIISNPKADCRCDKPTEAIEQTDDDALLPPGEYEPIVIGPVAKDETFCGGQP